MDLKKLIVFAGEKKHEIQIIQSIAIMGPSFCIKPIHIVF